MSKEEKFESAHQPAGGWGSVKAVTKILAQEKVLLQGGRVLLKQNKPDGFACVSCAWAKPAQSASGRVLRERRQGHRLGNHQQARSTPAFSQRHTVTELEAWSDHALEAEGRLTAPLRWDAASDKLPGSRRGTRPSPRSARELQALRRRSRSVFYASGRASLETSYMYQLLARMYGNNNLPDSSNMCHESTSVALPETHRRAGRHGGAGRFRARPTASSSSARTSASTARACCTSCRRRASAACRSSPSTRCASAAW